MQIQNKVEQTGENKGGRKKCVNEELKNISCFSKQYTVLDGTFAHMATSSPNTLAAFWWKQTWIEWMFVHQGTLSNLNFKYKLNLAVLCCKTFGFQTKEHPTKIPSAFIPLSSFHISAAINTSVSFDHTVSILSTHSQPGLEPGQQCVLQCS